jgi:hypothetical protein
LLVKALLVRMEKEALLLQHRKSMSCILIVLLRNIELCCRLNELNGMFGMTWSLRVDGYQELYLCHEVLGYYIVFM